MQWRQDWRASKRKKDVRFFVENGAWLYRQNLIIYQAYCSYWKIPWLLPEVLFLHCIPTLVCCERTDLMVGRSEKSSLNIEIMVVKHTFQRLPFFVDNWHSSAVGRHNHDCEGKGRGEILNFWVMQYACSSCNDLASRWANGGIQLLPLSTDVKFPFCCHLSRHQNPYFVMHCI